MKAIMVTFDSLNRRMLPNYGNTRVIAPAFERLGGRCTRFDRCYAGSLPCMPARRELHTARENFLHARWCALEPFDDSAPELLGRHGVYTHLTTDHVHYWEDEGFGYHSRYRSFQFSRGQEGDPAWGRVDTAELERRMAGRRVPKLRVQDAVNRERFRKTGVYPQHVTFQNGLDFIETNRGDDNWFLHIETFDPHEPFTAPQAYRALYGLTDTPDQKWDWPDYKRRTDAEPDELIARYRLENMALVSFCADNLGRLLDAMDRCDLWRDTLLIVNTDHGFMLGEHGWLGKNTGPYFDEIAHLPLFIHDPRCADTKPVSDALVQTVDLPATLLDFFGVPLTPDMTGRPIRGGVRVPERDFAIWGLFGGQLNCTDGRYVYLKAPRPDARFACYTLAGAHFTRRAIQAGDARYELSLSRPFSFTKGYPLLRIGNMRNDFRTVQPETGTLLYDIEADPAQEHLLTEQDVAARLDRMLAAKLRELDAPDEVFGFYGLE